MAQPFGFVDPEYSNHVCRLNKAIYGVKQAPRAWYIELRTYLLSVDFINSVSDTSLFIRKGINPIYVLVYVDDIIVTGRGGHSGRFEPPIRDRLVRKPG